MFNGILFFVSIIFGIGLGIIYNKFIIKNYPEEDRKLYYFITIVVFLIFSLSMYIVFSVKSYTNSVISEYSVKIERFINENYADDDFVKNGYDLQKMNNDVSQLDSTVSEVLPSHEALGVNKIIYDYAINKALSRFNIVHSSAEVINSYGNESNILTVSSLVHGLENDLISLINKIALSIITVVSVILLAYVVCTLIAAKREEKSKGEEHYY